MAREKKPPTDTVRIAKELVRRINRLAAHADMSVPDWLAAKLSAVIESDEKRMIADLEKEQSQPASGGALPPTGKQKGKKT